MLPTPSIVSAPDASTIYSIEDAHAIVGEDSPLMRKHYVVEPESDDEGNMTINEKVPLYQATIVSRLLFLAEFVMCLGGLMIVVGEIVHYCVLWNFPSDEVARTGTFHYPLALVTSIYVIGLCLFGIGGSVRVFFVDSVHKIKWWLLFLGTLVSLCPAAIVIFKDDVFMRPLVLGRIVITSEYRAVYSMTALGIMIVIPMIISLDLFNPVLKKARVYKLLCLFGIFCYQISLIVTIHSLLVQVGFGLFVLGILLIASGYFGGRIAEKRRSFTNSSSA